MTIPIDAFLTSYDPSDLPGQSIDPLGFERGYLLLAEKLLPGLTNVAAKPRYFGMLCAGVQIAETGAGATPRAQAEARREAVLRLERLWALANVLASREDPSLATNGIRGLRYAERQANEIEKHRHSHTTPDFALLSRQAPYGVLGIYGSVAERLRLVDDRKALTLTPSIGTELGRAFVEETQLPSEVYAAVRTARAVPTRRLVEWGARAHVAGRIKRVEAECLRTALHWDSIRWRMADILAAHPVEQAEPEVQRLQRIAITLRHKGSDNDLCETAEAIVAYERAYAQTQIAFERLLWLARSTTEVSVADAGRDAVVALARKRTPAVVRALENAIGRGGTEHFRRDINRLEDVRTCLRELAAVADDGEAFVHTLLARHTDIQHGKFDRGRRKSAWIELRGELLFLAMSRVGGMSGEPKSARQIVPHFYRTAAADALRRSGRAA